MAAEFQTSADADDAYTTVEPGVYDLGVVSTTQLRDGILVDANANDEPTVIYSFTVLQGQKLTIGVIVPDLPHGESLSISLWDSNWNPVSARVAPSGNTMDAVLAPGTYSYQVQFGDGATPGSGVPYQLQLSLIGGGESSSTVFVPTSSAINFGGSASTSGNSSGAQMNVNTLINATPLNYASNGSSLVQPATWSTASDASDNFIGTGGGENSSSNLTRLSRRTFTPTPAFSRLRIARV